MVVLIYISLMMNDVEHFCMYLPIICMSSLKKMSIQIFLFIFKLNCLFFSIEFYEFFTYFGY